MEQINFEVGIDIGGTFTDLVALDSIKNKLITSKVLNSPDRLSASVLDACSKSDLSINQINYLVHGTTLVTNLLIERTGGKVGLITSSGFRDVIEIGYGFRKDTFRFNHEQIPPLVPRHLRSEITGRISKNGEEISEIDEIEVRNVTNYLLKQGIEAIAVCLYNSYANAIHERKVEKIIRNYYPELFISLSVDVDPRIGEYERSSTCSLNAMAMGKFQQYANDLSLNFRPKQSIRFMHSGGGLLTLNEAKLRPIQLARSGPAGGVLAAMGVAEHIGYNNVITMDVGGTSTDICIMNEGQIQNSEVIEIEHGIPVRIQSLDINTIGAGGGSVVQLDPAGAVRVGPKSVGANPGPACYGRGGTIPSVTDANLVRGIIPESGLLGGNVKLEKKASVKSLEKISKEINISVEKLSEGVWNLVNANIAQAIREVTVKKGIDIRNCALVAFGGAGPQHAAGVASELGVSKVIIPNHCSLLSAIGLLAADLKVFSAQTALLPLEKINSEEVQKMYEKLKSKSIERLGIDNTSKIISEKFAGLRYVGQWHYVPIQIPEKITENKLYSIFETQHEKMFGTRIGTKVEIVDIGVTVIQPRQSDLKQLLSKGKWDNNKNNLNVNRLIYIEDNLISLSVYNRDNIPSGSVLPGPCLIEESNSVTFVPKNSEVNITEEGYLLISIKD